MKTSKYWKTPRDVLSSHEACQRRRTRLRPRRSQVSVKKGQEGTRQGQDEDKTRTSKETRVYGNHQIIPKTGEIRHQDYLSVWFEWFVWWCGIIVCAHTHLAIHGSDRQIVHEPPTSKPAAALFGSPKRKRLSPFAPTTNPSPYLQSPISSQNQFFCFDCKSLHIPSKAKQASNHASTFAR